MNVVNLLDNFYMSSTYGIMECCDTLIIRSTGIRNLGKEKEHNENLKYFRKMASTIRTCMAVFLTNSNSPSKLASSRRANGSKLTRRANFVLPLSPISDLFLRITSSSGDVFSSFELMVGVGVEVVEEVVIVDEAEEDVIIEDDLSVSSMLLLFDFSISTRSTSGNKNDGGISMRRD